MLQRTHTPFALNLYSGSRIESKITQLIPKPQSRSRVVLCIECEKNNLPTHKLWPETLNPTLFVCHASISNLFGENPHADFKIDHLQAKCRPSTRSGGTAESTHDCGNILYCIRQRDIRAMPSWVVPQHPCAAYLADLARCPPSDRTQRGTKLDPTKTIC